MTAYICAVFALQSVVVYWLLSRVRCAYLIAIIVVAAFFCWLPAIGLGYGTFTCPGTTVRPPFLRVEMRMLPRSVRSWVRAAYHIAIIPVLAMFVLPFVADVIRLPGTSYPRPFFVFVFWLCVLVPALVALTVKMIRARGRPDG
jgi:hypothetical protein